MVVHIKLFYKIFQFQSRNKEIKHFCKDIDIHLHVTPCWPRTIGKVVSFFRILKKIIRWSHIEGTQRQQVSLIFLLLYHSTPHCSTYESKDCCWNVVLTQQEFAGNKAKGRISKRVFQENKACQIFRKTIIPYLLIRTSSCTYQGARNVRFFGKSGVLCFLDTPALRLALFFCLITDELKIS